MAIAKNTSGTYITIRVSDAESLTGWSAIKLEGAGGGPSAFASVGSIDLVAQGSNAVASIANKQRVQLLYTSGTSYDFTPGSTGSGTVKVPSGIFYVWALFLAAGSAFTKATGGLQITLGDGTGTSCWNVAGSDTYSGGFQKWAVHTEIAASENIGGAANLGNITQFGFICDVGGTTTRFDNMVVDAIDIGLGLSFNADNAGSTTLFGDMTSVDGSEAIGVLSNVNGIYFSQGSLEIGGTNMVSTGETLVFSDTVGGTYTYNFDVVGSVSFNNSSVRASGTVDFNFDSSGATTFSMNGGAVDGFNTLTTGASQTMDGVVFSSGGTSTVANTIENSTFSGCDTITVNGSLSSCTVSNPTGSVGAIVSTLSKVPNCSFVKGAGTNHAVELTGAASAYTWSGKLTGYDAGTAPGAGTNVAVTGGSITGNEAIHITATSGTFTIDATNGDIPSVSSAGAVVYVTTGGATFNATVSPLPTPNYEWRLYEVSAVGSLAGANEVAGVESETGSTINYPHTYTNQPMALQIISNEYIEKITYFTFNSNNIDTTINLEIDTND